MGWDGKQWSRPRRLIEEEFSAERMTADYLRVYEEAIASGGEAR